MEKYLQTKKTSTNSSTNIVPWYKDSSRKRAFQLRVKAFKDFSQLNSTRDDVTFVMLASTDSSQCGEVAATVLIADESPIDFDPPGKPFDLAIAQNAKNEATLSWSKSKFGSASILSYVVHHRVVQDPPNKWEIQKTSGVVESLRVSELTTDRTYEFAVQAQCKIGDGPLSDCVTLKISSLASEQSATSASPSSLKKGIHSLSSVESSGDLTSHSVIPTVDGRMSISKPSLSTRPPPYSQAFGPYESDMSSLMSMPCQASSDNQPPGNEPRGNPMHRRATFPPKMQRYSDQPPFTSATIPVFQSPSMPATARHVPPEMQQYNDQPPFFSVSVASDSSFQSLSMPANVRQTDSGRDSEDKWKIFSNNLQLMMPRVINVTYKSIELKWTKPECGPNEVENYIIYYHQKSDPDNTLKRLQVTGDEESCIVKGLTHGTGYVLKLTAKLSSKMTLETDEKEVETPAYLPETIRTKSNMIQKKTDHQPAIYELIKKQTMKNREKKVAKFVVGEPDPLHQGKVKVLMVVGATGAGKKTLINGIANYMYGVQWDDDFRFVLVANEPTKKSQAHSQTSWITAYTLYRCKGSPIDYSLTIIDTPSGFGDTEGIERDKKIVNQIKDFFSIKPPNGIDVLHGIGFVAQASLARLSHSQMYIFDSILSIYGRDVASNIFLMTTFADGQKPPVLEAVKVSKIPHQTYFKFNNSALFVTGEDDSFDFMFWKMGVISFLDFFVAFGKAEHRSLQLTREVLDEREQLENVLKELQPQIHAGLTKMDELQKVVTVLQRNKALIEQNKDFNFTVKVTKQKKVDTPRGRYTTNCLNCNYTCHDDCAIADNAQKRGCWAMDGNSDCRICPDKCIWSKHVNNPYIFVLYEEEEIRTSAELKERYDTAKEGESSAEAMISNIKGELEYLEDQVLKMVDKARKSLVRLDEIALKPNPLSEVDYIDKLIASEELQHKPGWLERVNAYKQLRKRAELLRQIKTHDPSSVSAGSGPIFLSYYAGEGSAATAYSSETIEVFNRKQEKKPASTSYFGSFNITRLWKSK